ncbi:HamA C-terminal domain-containing protein [Morganella morganii]|uniref:HamA C-terminal domain-containing protein n=1 Tax=Morganella morganii TaxID=582 RepID=UPI00350F0BA0
MDFDILIDQSLSSFVTESGTSKISNNNLLSIINDFEDGDWRYQKFHRFIWDNILQTALSNREREALIHGPGSSLALASKNLRLTDSDKDISKGSELAEIFLYGIMRHHFKALPVVPKIFYKQNSQDNAKGADSVHVVIIDNNNFSLWFGEAKFYNSIDDGRFDTIITSVKNSIMTEKLRKENSIILNTQDLCDLVQDEELRLKIFSVLSSDNSMDNIKPLLNIPIFILHECPITESSNCLSDTYKSSIVELHKERAQAFFKKHHDKIKTIYNYDKIKFHLILFPVPNKDLIINKFVDSVRFYKEQ